MIAGRRAALAAAALSSAMACSGRTLPAEGQLVVYIDTDAPLDLPQGARLGPTDAAPLFDRLRVDILEPDGTPACAACAQDFSVARDQLARGEISFGVRPPFDVDGLVVRARLFPGTRERGGEPPADATIDRAMALPRIEPEGVVEVTVPLPIASVGVPADLANPDPVLAGRVVRATLADGLAPAPCTAEGDDGQVCVPGGAFWMSDPTILLLEPSGTEPPARIAVVSPFWMDATEVTVDAFRRSKLATSTDPRPTAGTRDDCTYTPSPGPNETLPVTCISWKLAAAYCALHGGRLPTEAEFELVAGGRTSQRYPWGADDPVCSDAVYARADPGTQKELVAETGACAGAGTDPAPARSGERDAVALPGGNLFDLAGDVSEWAFDVFEDLGDACWGRGLVRDPRCEPPGTPASAPRTVRGGSWVSLAAEMRSTVRISVDPSHATHALGFRCVRSGR